MRKLTIMLLCAFAIVACKKENNPLTKIKKASQEVKKTANGVKNAKNIIGGLDDANELVAKLKELEPIGKESWKSWMPEQVKDLNRTSFTINSGSLGNLSSLKLQYKNPDDIQKQFKAEIIDGAGNGSGVAYMYKMTANVKLDSENEKGYKKIHKRGKTTVKETFSKQSHGSRTKMEFLINERFAVNISANNIEADALWAYVQAMNFNKLTK